MLGAIEMDTGRPVVGHLKKVTTARAGYRKINEVINSILFDGRFAMQPLYLDLESELLVEIAGAAGLPSEKFTGYLGKLTAACLNWETRNPYSWFEAELRAWENDPRLDAPPFTALLCALAFAAERMREDGNYSHNNYYQRLFEVLGVTAEGHQAALRREAKITRKFWNALNQWLTQNDFEYGRPTARRITSWEYASYPLSQALVRDGDRKLFHSMFTQFGLSPGEKLTDADMIQYLQEWMPGPHSSNWLRKIWATQGLKERVAAAARSELEAWDGAETAAGEHGTKTTITLAASLSGFPRQQLKLFLAVNERPEDDQPVLSLTGEVGPAAEEAFSNITSGLWFSAMPSEGLSFLEPRQELALEPLMLAPFELSDATGRQGYKRIARPILPLAQLEGGRYYREMSRISLLRPHLILCHSTWAEKTRQILEAHAREGFKEVKEGGCPGLPQNWVLFKDVELLRVPNESSKNLQALVPLADSGVIELTGGLRLTHSIWHSEAPPEIAASAKGSYASLRIEKYALEESPEILTEVSSGDSSVAFDLSKLETAGDDLTIKLFEGEQKKPSADVSVSLRNANTPSRFGLLKGAGAAYELDRQNGRSGLSTVTAFGSASGAPHLSGMLIQGGPEVASFGFAAPLTALTQLHASEENEVTASNYAAGSATGLAGTCVLSGVHYWICDPFLHGDTAQDPRWMRCQNCKVAVLARDRGAPARGATPPNRRQHAVRDNSPSMPARRPEKYAADLIFDALCYLGSGSWRKLQDISSASTPDPFFPSRFSQALGDLGHIDTSFKSGTVREESWICAPPAVIYTGTDAAFISGFRSASLIERLTAAVEKAGGMIYKQDQDNAPAAWLIFKTPASALAAHLAGVTDPHGRHIAIQKSPALQIASHFPAADTILSSLPDIHIGSRDGLEQFDPLAGYWSAATEVLPGHAYRTLFAGRRYFFCSGVRRMKEGPHHAVKVLAARAAGVRLHSYNPSNGSFSTLAGCEPPGLLRRALIASSGLLPRRDGNLLHYFYVAPETAAAVMTKLYS